MSKQDKIKEYDEEPVMYCARCYSLNIVHEDVIDSDCCGRCGCTDFKTSSIEEWERLYKERYGHKFVENSHDLRKSPVFMLPMDRLKTMVYKDECWKKLCRTMYPTFPNGLSRVDSIVLLFTMLIQDNRLDELRVELINQNYKK